MDILLDYAGLLAVIAGLAVTFFTGSWIERRHFQSLRRRERARLSVPVVSLDRVSTDAAYRETRMVMGSCVIAADFFKRHLAALRDFFGGRVGAYESLLDRARREAILRIRENAEGAIEIVCARIETSNLGIGTVEATAYGTAVFPPSPNPQPGASGKRSPSRDTSPDGR